MSEDGGRGAIPGGTCPACGAGFVGRRVAGCAVPSCESCGLAVLAADDLQRLARELRRALSGGADPATLVPELAEGAPLREGATCPACGGALNVVDGREWAVCDGCHVRAVPWQALAELALDPGLAQKEPHDLAPISIRAGRRDLPRAVLVAGALGAAALAVGMVVSGVRSLARMTPPEEARTERFDRRAGRDARAGAGIFLVVGALPVAAASAGLFARALRTSEGPMRTEPCPRCEAPVPDHEPRCLSCGAGMPLRS
jgi:hypothetical protein